MRPCRFNFFSKTGIRYKKKKRKKEKKISRGGQIIPKLEFRTSPGKQSKVCEEKKTILKTVLWNFLPLDDNAPTRGRKDHSFSSPNPPNTTYPEKPVSYPANTIMPCKLRTVSGIGAKYKQLRRIRLPLHSHLHENPVSIVFSSLAAGTEGTLLCHSHAYISLLCLYLPVEAVGMCALFPPWFLREAHWKGILGYLFLTQHQW